MVLRLMYEPQELVDTSNLSNEEWLSYRRRGIGGSNAAAILGISPWRTARDLYYDKLSVVKADMDENWVALEMGHLLENLVARIFAKKTGLRIFQRKVMFQHPLYPWMLADLDYLVELPDGSNAICKRQIVVNQRQRKAVTGSGFAYCLHGWPAMEGNLPAGCRAAVRSGDIPDSLPGSVHWSLRFQPENRSPR